MSDQPGCPCSICDGNGEPRLPEKATRNRRWSVAKRDGRWRVIDRGVWSETYDTLPEAHNAATTHATADLLYAPGGLALFSRLLDACDWIYDRKATP